VAYVADGALLECPVCSSPLHVTIEDESDPDGPDETEELSTAS